MRPSSPFSIVLGAVLLGSLSTATAQDRPARCGQHGARLPAGEPSVESGVPSDLVLCGVLLAGDPGRRLAVLSAGGVTRVAAPGEPVFGGRLMAVDAEGVVLDVAGRPLRLAVPTPARRLAGAASTLATGDPPGPGSGSSTSAPAMHSLARAQVERRLAAEMDRILKETRTELVVGPGRHGVALTQLADGSLLTDVGLRPGDVITEVNGRRVYGLATLADLYTRLQGEADLHAVVLRGGRPLVLRLRLR